MSKEKNPLKVLFPEANFITSNEKSITITPLKLPDLPKVLDSFSTIIRMSQEAKNPAELVLKAAEELMQLLPFCAKCQPEDIYAADLPDILSIILDQNLPESAMGKWKALIQKIPVEIEGLDQSVLSKS